MSMIGGGVGDGEKCYVYRVLRFCLPSEALYGCRQYHATVLGDSNIKAVLALNDFLQAVYRLSEAAEDVLKRLEDAEKALEKLKAWLDTTIVSAGAPAETTSSRSAVSSSREWKLLLL